MIFKNRKSTKLFISNLVPQLCIAFISCLVFAVICNSIINSYVKSETGKAVNQIQSMIKEQMLPNFLSVENFTKFAEKNHDQNILQQEIYALGKNMNNIDDFYYSTVKSRNNGGFFLWYDTEWEPEEDYEPSEQDWFRVTIRNSGRLTFIGPEVDETTGDLNITISQAAYDKANLPLGVIATDMTLNALSEIVEKTYISENNKIYILDSDGSFMTNEDSSKLMNSNYFDETELDFNAEEYLDGKTKIFTQGKNYYAVSKIASTPWFVVAEGPTKDFSKVFLFKLVIVIICLALLSVFNALFNCWFIKKMQKNEVELGAKMFEETQNLVVATKESAATSQDQNAAVKEIVATVADSKSLSENITGKISDVSDIAQKTSQDVNEGVSLIQQNVEQLHAIYDANQQTIEGMKELGKRIESIWDIVTLINSVADQAKIIAFNAELEASSAGEAGKSFHVVASEIRRLSDGIIDGTKEIKEKISEIQQSSDTLILASEGGTERINSGYENAKNLETKFESIKTSSDITSDSASDIKEIIQQQAIATEQIFIALKQISSGIENFSVATDNISSSAENLKEIAGKLNNTVSE